MMSAARHIKECLSFSNIKEININQAFERHLSQKNITTEMQNIKTNINIDEIKNQKKYRFKINKQPKKTLINIHLNK